MELELIKQPNSKCNVRYLSEHRLNGNIYEECNGQGEKTYLRVKVHGCSKDLDNLFVEASCVTKEYPHKPHVYQLCGKNCYNGKYYAPVDNTTMMAVFTNMNIIRIKKAELAINKRENSCTRYQGFNTNSRIDLTSFKLKFKIVRKRDGIPEFESIPHCPPFVSRVITNKRSQVPSSSIKIEKLAPESCSIEGGKDVIIICSSPIRNIKNIIVKIYEARELDNVVQKNGILWESSGENICVYPKHTVSFIAPKYTGPSQMNKPIKVWVQLHQTDNSLASNLIDFKYIPIQPSRNLGKEMRVEQDHVSSSSSNEDDYHQPNISTFGKIKWQDWVFNRFISKNMLIKHDTMMACDTFDHTGNQGLQDENVTPEQNRNVGSNALSSTCSYHPSNEEEKKLENFGINHNSYLNNFSPIDVEMCQVHSNDFPIENITDEDIFVATGETTEWQNYIGNDNRYLTTFSSLYEEISNYGCISENMAIENEVITSRNTFDAINYQLPPCSTILHSASNCQRKRKWDGDVKCSFRQRGY